MADSVSTLSLRVDSQTALSHLNEFGLAAAHLGGTTDILKGKLLQLSAAFLSLNFGKRLVAEAAEGQEVLGKYTQVMGRYRNEADKLVTELRNSFNFDATSAQQSIATMTDILTKSGLELKQAFEFTSNLQKRAADLEAFTNAEGGAAGVSDALTRGILGNQLALRRLGIVLDEGALKTQMLEDKQKGLRFATENAAKMHARYALIMKQTQNAEGQVARESDNFSNKLRKFKAIYADFRNELGDIIIPTATKLITGVEKVMRAFEGASESTKTFVVVAGTALGTFVATSPWLLKLATGIKAYRSAKMEATATEQANNAASQQTTVTKEREAGARMLNARAIQAENAALGTQTRASAASTFGSIPSKADKRASKISWRAQTEGARKFAALPGAMPYTTASLGKSTAKGTLGKAGSVGALANLAPLFGKLTAPIGKLNSALGTTFSEILKHVPLVTRFSGILGKCLGLFGTGGAVVGGVIAALTAFKNAPQWLEQFLDGMGPKILEFGAKIPEYLWAGIKGGIELGKNGAQAAGKLVVDAMVGAGQFGKRLLGFETEASRAYKLNKQIEENNRKRQELLEVQKKQLVAENAVLEARKTAEQTRTNAELKLNATNDTESVKLAKASRERDAKAAERTAKERELAQLQSKLSGKNLTNAQRDEAIERSKTLTEELGTINEEWGKLAESVVQLEDAARNASKSFVEDQSNFEKAQKDSDLELENARNQIGLENAGTFGEKRAALTSGINRAQSDLDASNAAVGEANALNERIKTVNAQLESPAVARALADLQELAESGDFQSQNARIKFAGATSALESAGYNVPEMQFGKGVAKQILEQTTEQRKADSEGLEDLITERDEKQALAAQRGSRLQELNSLQRDRDRLEKDRQAALSEEGRNEAERQRQKARDDASFRRGIDDTYFQRRLSAVDRFYGDDKLGASQARYQMIGERGANDWNQSVAALEEQQREIDTISGRLQILNMKNQEGRLTEDEAKERDYLKSQLETRQSEYDSDYQSAIQKKLATEDNLLGLENTMREEYLNEAQKWVDETTNAWKEQAQAEEEAQRKRLEERSKVEEEARMAVSGMRAVASGSSEAFNIASKIYDRGREELPPEKKIEKSTQQIEAYVKAMQEQMMDYFRDQTLNGVTLSMGY